MGCLRMYFNSKFGKNTILIPKQLLINNNYTKILNYNCGKNAFYKYFLDTMISYTKKCSKIIKNNDFGVHTVKIKNNISNDTTYENINIQGILDKLPQKYCDNYDTWNMIGLLLADLSTDKNDYYDMWIEWSSKSVKFKDYEMVNRWKSYKNRSQDKPRYNIGVLINYAKEEQITDIYINKKQDIDEIVKSYPIKEINIEIPEYNLTQLNQDKLTPEIYSDIIDKKLIGVKSEKGTGKTSNLFEALFELNMNPLINEDTSILILKL